MNRRQRPSPVARLFRRPGRAFHVAGLVGLAAAVGVGLAVVLATGRSPVVLLLLAVSAVGTFLGLAVLTKAVTGRESLTYYHHQFAILLVAWASLAATGRPVLPYLDATVLGVGAFLAIGRLGCLMAGCCHGRPARHGIRYTPAHARAGFPWPLVGVRLVPVQAVEAAAVALVVAGGVVLTVAGSRPGLALAWYLAAYATIRFFLEMLRGDAGRLFLAGLSEAQWTSLLVVSAVALAGAAGVLPAGPWQPVLAVAVAGSAVAVVVRGRVDRAVRLRMPGHSMQMAAALATLTEPGDGGSIRVAATSEGLRMSAERLPGVVHVAVSGPGGPLSPREVRGVSRSLAPLCGSADPPRTVSAPHGVTHFLFDDERSVPAAPSVRGAAHV